MSKKPVKSTTMGATQMGELINVALGKEKADLVVTNGLLLNVYTGELLEGFSVAVKGERIAYMGQNADPAIGPQTQIIDARGKTIIPGLIDAHNHLTYFYTVDQFLRYAMRGGTTSIITETLEITFPLGYQGLLQILESFSNQPIKIFSTMPAMVSLSPTVQANAIDVATLRKLLQRGDVVGLGESYWLPVTRGDKRLLELFAETSISGKKLIGHSAGASGGKLAAYLACGICGCHEPINLEETLERLRLGIHVLIREGDVRRDLEAISRIKDKGIDLRRLAAATDGIEPKHLIEGGYMEFWVQKAIDLGFDPVVAIQMATINAAEYLSLDDLIGGIAPGRYADLVIIPDIRKIQAEYVISNGRVIAQDGQLVVQPRRHAFPKWAFRAIRLPRRLEPADFAIRVEGPKGQVTDLITREAKVMMPVSGGKIEADVSRDIIKVAAIDFRNQPGRMAVALVRGFKMRSGALATSGAWDISNILVLGLNETDMAQAANRVAELQGGIVVCAGGQILVAMPLPLSERPIEDLAQSLADIQQKATQLGIHFPNAQLTLSILTSPAIPFFRLCEEGLVDIREGKFVNLIVR